MRRGLLALTLLGGCGDQDLTGVIVEGCTADCRPGSIERAVLGKLIAAYQPGRVVSYFDSNKLEVMDDNLEPVQLVELDLGAQQRITHVAPWLGDSVLVTISVMYSREVADSVELWLLGPDLAVQRKIPAEVGFSRAFSPSIDYIVEGAGSATQSHQAVVRASRLGESTPLWEFSNPSIVFISRVWVGPDGTVIATGGFNRELDLGTGTVLTAPSGQSGRFTVKLDATGNVLWLRDEFEFAFAFRPGKTLVATNPDLLTLDDSGAVESSVPLLLGNDPMNPSTYPSSILVDDTSVFVAGKVGQYDSDAFLADVAGSTPEVLLEGHEFGENELRIVGMNAESIFAQLVQVPCFECPQDLPTYTVDDVTVVGSATLRLRR